MPSTPNLQFNWPILNVVVEGLSILDVPRLELRSMEEATTFIKAYGFDPSSAEDQQLIWDTFDEAVQFIEQTLKDPEYPTVPEHLRTRQAVNDIRRLLIIASETLGSMDQVFSCAILRLMHVLIHHAHDPRRRFLSNAQSQILGKLDPYLYTDPATQTTYLGPAEDGTGIKLLFFKKKERKDRERELVKLLHKAESLVEEIYDRMGFRLVTETKFDAIRAVRLLLEKNIISLPNIRPGRARNRLIDMHRLQFETDRIQSLLKTGNQARIDVDKLIRRLERRIGFRRLGRSLLNPHSSDYYRAIQFTCRAIVKVPNRVYELREKLRTQLENLHGGSQILAEVFTDDVKPFEYVFFPYEIQIMDVKAYADSIFGKSSHEQYRKKQIKSARNRVFGRPHAKDEDLD